MTTEDANESGVLRVIFRGGYVEDESGERWWSADVLARAERETERARADFESLAFDAARVIVAHERGDVDALARAVESLRSNGRHKWWEDV
jgi:hypothetical protein